MKELVLAGGFPQIALIKELNSSGDRVCGDTVCADSFEELSKNTEKSIQKSR